MAFFLIWYIIYLENVFFPLLLCSILFFNVICFKAASTNEELCWKKSKYFIDNFHWIYVIFGQNFMLWYLIIMHISSIICFRITIKHEWLAIFCSYESVFLWHTLYTWMRSIKLFLESVNDWRYFAFRTQRSCDIHFSLGRWALHKFCWKKNYNRKKGRSNGINVFNCRQAKINSTLWKTKTG